MNDIINIILENFQYVYPGFITIFIYQYINGDENEAIERYFLKIVCISYVIVKIIGSLCNIFYKYINCTEDNIKNIFNNLALLLCSFLLPFLINKIRTSKIIKKFLKWNKIPRNISKNIEELIVGNCPSNNVVYCVVYLENTIIEGVLLHSEEGENGFIALSFWKQKILNVELNQKELKNMRNNKGKIVIPKKNINYFDYEYIPNEKNVNLPDKIPETIKKL